MIRIDDEVEERIEKRETSSGELVEGLALEEQFLIGEFSAAGSSHGELEMPSLLQKED